MKPLLRTFAFVRPYWKLVGAVFLLSLLFVLFNSFSLWMSASFVTALFSDETPAVQTSEGPAIQESATPGAGQTAPESGPTSALAGISLNDRIKAWTNALIVRDSKIDTLKILCVIIFSAFLLKSFCSFGKNVLLRYVEHRVLTDIRDHLYSHLQSLSLSYFHRKRLGEIASVVMNDVGLLSTAFDTSFNKIIVTPMNVLWLVALLFIINWKLALLFLVMVPLNGFIIAKIGSSIRRKTRRCQRQIAEVVAMLHEALNNIKIVMAFAMSRFEVDRFKTQTKRYFQLVFRQKVLQSLSSPATEVIGAAIGVGILWYAGSQVLRNQVMTPEDFIRSLVIMFSILQPLKSLGGLHNALQVGAAASERVFEMLDTKPTVIERPGAIDKATLDEGIVLEDVSFKYSSDLPLVLDSVALEVKRGEIVALVGPSGAGKSTLVDLVPRFYDVTSGAVKIDGIDIRDIKLASLRRLMGIVTQETILFNDSVKNNIAYGMRDVPLDAVTEAARIANAAEFVEELGDGYATVIGERGVRLSGGQKQRLAIARAILQNPPLLLLDEATSSLDSESEQLVQEALNNLMKDRTVLVIAHRLSTVIDADKIVVIDRGKVEAVGKHGDLLKTCELYDKLYQMQFGLLEAQTEEVGAQ